MWYVWTLYPTPYAFSEISSLWLMGIKYNSRCFWVWGIVWLGSNCSFPGSVFICLTAFPPCAYNSYLAKDSEDPMQSSSSAFRLPAYSVLSVLVVLTSANFHLWLFNSVRLLGSAWFSLLCASLDFTFQTEKENKKRKESVSRLVVSDSLQPHGL